MVREEGRWQCRWRGGQRFEVHVEGRIDKIERKIGLIKSGG